jgi:hypothetical protein
LPHKPPNPQISNRRYEKALVEPELHGFGDELLKKFEETEQSLLTVR